MSNEQWDSMTEASKRWGITHVCAWCGSENVSRLHGWDKWSVPNQVWEPIVSKKDDVHWCKVCMDGVDVLIETVNIGEYEDESVT